MEKTFSWNEPGRETLELTLLLENNEIQEVSMKARGCLSFLKMCQTMKAQMKGSLLELLPPSGNDHASMIWREAILKLQENWKLPVDHEELCHCRKISTDRVDRSIVYGAHTIDEIRHRTSANTGCGTCLNDVKLMIKNRFKT